MNRELYWVAVRGAAVPSWPLPVDEARMRDTVVVVGRGPSEQTLWLFRPIDGSYDTDDTFGIGPSNYEFLIGYQTLAAQQAALARLLYAKRDARAEVSRAFREETIILGVGGPSRSRK